MFIETPLIFKTVVILSIQLGLVLITCFHYLKKARIAYENGTTLLGYKFRGSVNMKRKLDLIPYTEPKKNFPKPMEKYIDNNTTLHKIAKNQDEVIELLKEGYNIKRIINYRTSHNENFNEDFVKGLKLSMPDIVYIYSQNSATNFLKFIKLHQTEGLWMNTNLMCIGEKTSAILNEIKWKKIFLFNPGEEEFLLYKI